MLNKDKWLITIDLDGTMLRTDKGNYGEAVAHEENVRVIRELTKQGHKVAIVTGRPWRDTERFYKELGLDTIVGNHNGAVVHHPFRDDFTTIETSINKDLFYGMINETDLGKAYINILIEYPENTYILHEDETLKKVFHIEDYSEVKKLNLTDELPENPRSICFTLGDEYDHYDVLFQLKRAFGDAFLFRFWIDEETGQVNLEVNQRHSTKSSVMRLVASHYNIPMRNTISFGDGLNDIDMLSEAAIGVAMKNASNEVKGYANDVTDYTNNEGGVGKYLAKYFNI